MTTSPREGFTKDLTSDLENWMTKLPAKLRSIPIIYLSIPGSHDSFTSHISSKSDISPDAEKILQDLKFLGPCLKVFMNNWSRTQEVHVTDQLMNGIRYFDLRIATKKGEENLYFVHGLYSNEVQEVFDEMAAFLETHPQEIVFLDCQHFYAFTQNDHEKLMQKLSETFGPKLMPFSAHMDHLTLEYMTTQFRYQVIAIYRSDAARFGQPLLWPSSSFPNPWPNTDATNKLIFALNCGIRTRTNHTAFISQCVLTPTYLFIFKNLLSTLKKKCAIDLQKTRLEWIRNQSPGPGGLNIMICDFIDLNDLQYVKEVIRLNEKLINDVAKSSDTVINVLPSVNSF